MKTKNLIVTKKVEKKELSIRNPKINTFYPDFPDGTKPE